MQTSTHRRGRRSQILLVWLLGKVHRDPLAGGDQLCLRLFVVSQEAALRFPEGAGPKEGKGTGPSSEGTVFQLFPVIPPSLDMIFNPAKSSRTNPGPVT